MGIQPLKIVERDDERRFLRHTGAAVRAARADGAPVRNLTPHGFLEQKEVAMRSARRCGSGRPPISSHASLEAGSPSAGERQLTLRALPAVPPS
jgi:hypothetical protein